MYLSKDVLVKLMWYCYHMTVFISIYATNVYMLKCGKKTNVLRVLLNISFCTSSEFGRRNVCLWGLTSLTQKGCLNKKWSDFSSFRIIVVKISLQVRKQQNNTCNNSWLGCCSSSMNHRNMAWQNWHVELFWHRPLTSLADSLPSRVLKKL